MAAYGGAFELVRLFGRVATADPLSAVLLAVGALMTAAYGIVGGWLGAGALLDFLTRGSSD